MSQIIFNSPGKDEPGYLRRMKKALELKTAMESGTIVPENLDALIEFVLPYVKEPVDRDQARELLWDGSQNDFDRMLRAITGDIGSINPTNGIA